jgi:hypothetical protein
MIVQHGGIIGLDLAMAAPSSAGSWRWLRFSLRELLAMTAFVAVGLVSLLHANGWIPNLWFTTLLLSVGIAVACYRAGKTAGFAEGYALFAGAYALLLVLSAWPQSNQFMANPNAIHTMLITHSLNDWAFDHVLPLVREPPPEPEDPFAGGGFFGPGPIAQFGGMAPRDDLDADEKIVVPPRPRVVPRSPSNLSLVVAGGQTILDYPDPTAFHRVAHCLWAIAIGCCGGRLIRSLRAGPEVRTSPHAAQNQQ